MKISNTQLMQLIREQLNEIFTEIIGNSPINTKQYLAQYTKHIKSEDFEGKKVGQLNGMKLYEENDGKDFRVFLTDEEGVKAGAFFRARRKHHELKLISVDPKLRGKGIATKLLLKTMKRHPEIELWSTGVLVTEAGMKFNKRLFDTGKVDMWLSRTVKGLGLKNQLIDVDDDFWERPSRSHIRGRYGSPKRDAQEKEYRKKERQTIWGKALKSELFFRLK